MPKLTTKGLLEQSHIWDKETFYLQLPYYHPEDETPAPFTVTISYWNARMLVQAGTHRLSSHDGHHVIWPKVPAEQNVVFQTAEPAV